MKSKNINIKELAALMKEQLDEGKNVSFVPRGESMLPMLRGGEDMIILKKPEGRLHLFDVAMYYRKDLDSYVVHRVVGFKKDKTYVMLGDNNFQKEYGITDDDVLGVVISYYHKGKMRSVNSIPYSVYCNFWFYTRPIRSLFIRAKMSLSKRIG